MKPQIYLSPNAVYRYRSDQSTAVEKVIDRCHDSDRKRLLYYFQAAHNTQQKNKDILPNFGGWGA